MALYSQLFRWIIARINQRIKGPDDFHFIGILDIFGFENFEVQYKHSSQQHGALYVQFCSKKEQKAKIEFIVINFTP